MAFGEFHIYTWKVSNQIANGDFISTIAFFYKNAHHFGNKNSNHHFLLHFECKKCRLSIQIRAFTYVNWFFSRWSARISSWNNCCDWCRSSFSTWPRTPCSLFVFKRVYTPWIWICFSMRCYLCIYLFFLFNSFQFVVIELTWNLVFVFRGFFRHASKNKEDR